MHGWHMSSVIITDKDLACMNAIEKIFPILMQMTYKEKYSYSMQENF